MTRRGFSRRVVLGGAMVVIARVVVRVAMGEAVHRIEAYRLTRIVVMVRHCGEHYGRRTEREDRTKNPIMHISYHSRAQIY